MNTSQIIADRFEIKDLEKDLLGRGGMGDVYRATDTQTGDPVAVKALSPGVVARDPDILERFVREGEALRQLDHPNIVRMVAAVEEQAATPGVVAHYLVMEYVAGGSLQDLLAAQGPLPNTRALEIALEVADALTRAHHLGIIHRDLKPANVLLAKDGTPRLTDFGIAHVVDSPRLTQTGILVGTVDYLSPEACQGEPLDERTDIWAFGVLLYEMLTGERPFTGETLTAKLTAILTQPLPDLIQFCPDVPDALVDLVYRMLEKDRQQRIPSVRLVGAELEAILKGREVPTPVRLAPGESRFAPTTPPAAAPTQPQVAHNLPAQLTSFVGRERETAEVGQLLGATRLLTLTGPPGTGKTRLGLRVAAEVLDQFQDGVFFVDLAPIRDSGLVATTIAQVLGIGESGGQPLLDTLKNALRHKHLLLLLDNFEQIVDAAPLVGELLSSSPGLKALVTSREALRVYGEQEYPVPPLTLPDLDRAEPLRSLSQYEAIELFTRRARAVRPEFTLTEDNAPAVAEICVRLDGLPLAIELAAARSTMLSPEMMRRRLESRLGVLVAGPRDLPARQRTLRGAIDWSYDLLAPPEKTLFARLAVFQGGRSVEAVEAVCSHGITIEVLAGLESLLNKNLLRRIEAATEEPRFVMLEMIHEYAWERLEASGEAKDLQRRHAEYFLGLAERAEPELRGARQQDWFVQLRAEQDNLRAALAWSLGEGEAELGLRLVGALRDFWYFDGHSAEGLRWAEHALASAQDAPPAARAGALNAAGWLCFDTGDYRKGKTYSGEAVEIYQELGDEIGSAWALTFLGAHALPFPDECKEGMALCQEGLALFRELDHKPGIMQALTVLGELGRVDGDYDLAQTAYEECLILSRETGYKLREAITLANLASVAMYRGLLGQARALYAENLALFRKLGDKKYSAMNLAGMAGPVAAGGHPQAAARLLGASEALLEALGIIMHAGDWSDLDRDVAAVRGQLDEATFEAAWAEGRAMSLEQAVSYAFEVGQPGPTAAPPAPVREPEVAVGLPAFLEGEEDALPSPVFVARERELAQLEGHLDRALSGQGRVVFVTGEAGQGKTALVAEFARRAQAAHPDLVVAGGNCNAHTGIGDPYLPFREILDLLTGDVEARWAARAISQEQARRLWHTLPLTVQALVEAGPDLIDLFVPGAALVKRAVAFTPSPGGADWRPQLEELVERKRTVPGDPNLQQSALFEQYTRVLQALAGQRPLLLMLDDLQWADGGSTRLLFHLGRRIEGSRALIVGAYRPTEVALGRGGERHPLEPIVNEFKRQFGAIEVDLGQAEDRQFVEALLDSEPNRLGDVFRRTLYQQTRGHPLSTVELLRDMQERGDLVQDEEGRWVEGPALDWETLPARVEAVIAERIGRLAEPAREALRVASVEGEAFIAEVVARVLGVDERETVRWLSKLDREHRLVSAQGMRRMDPALSGTKGGQCPWPEPGRRLSLYRFRHILFQRYLYNSLGEGERAYLHEDVGTALEALYGEEAEEIALELARHFQEAGIAGKAVGYLSQAGDRARGLYAHPEALDCYRRALALLKELGEHGQAARMLMKMGLTYHNAFDFRAARQAYEEGFALWQQAGEMQPAVPPPPAPHALRMAAFEPTTLDPGLYGDTDSGIAIGHLFSGLVELSPEMDVLPDVARNWEVSEGGRKYVFHLRDDVRWSDGAPVTAGDFAYAWKRVLDPVTGSRSADLLYDVKGARAFHRGQHGVGGLGIQALDEATLAVELEEPTGYFLTLLTDAIAFPVPRHAVQAHGTAWTEVGNIVTNGPFRLAAWERGGSMVLERDPAYHGRFAGNVSRIELSFTSRDSTRLLQMYEDDRLDAVPEKCLLPAEMDRARQGHAGDHISGPGLGNFYVGFAADRPPFDDRRVRRAFTLATDRETLADVAGRGYRFPATGGFVPPGMPGHSPGIGLPYDPEAGRRLLAEAGYPGGRGFPTIEALVSNRPLGLPIVAYLKAQWLENLGIEVTWKQMEWGRFADRLSRETPHVWLIGWLADYPDPDSFLRCRTWRVYTGWQDEAFDALVEGAQRVTNQEERMRMYQQADRILVEEAPVLLLEYGRIHLLVKPWVSKFPMSAKGSWFWKDVIIEPH